VSWAFIAGNPSASLDRHHFTPLRGVDARCAPAAVHGADAIIHAPHQAVSPPRNTMKLLASLTSPYARKVRIALAEKKLEYALVEVSPWTAEETVAAVNPLAKIPVLIVEDGLHVYDSRVIVEYLDRVSHVSRLIPEPARQRITVKRWESLADGICDAAAAIVLEQKRPARQQSREWIERQRRKVEQGVAELARELADKPWCNGEGYSLADIATGCALGYLDFRLPELDWRDAHPNLKRLAEKLGKRASFADTVPPVA
jgi:glutathione S-transferase